MWGVFSQARDRVERFGVRLAARVTSIELRDGAFRWDQLITLAVIVGAIWIFVQNIPALRNLAEQTITAIQNALNNILNSGAL
ncbi:hypothetical protein [Alicyclobacillus sendaiensis]|uniref:Uncharacterized protein n=1 Tax=Alicyclobacillus sendaiensis PA2 TaxID=3029425 RepID=A0ABT6Y144_ALISE|nr:hypothetical protein [Alicyclobacillus sendaiensis]MDI9261069.1 hypothetical protein [Alicyclobacillus sendaiensis PA2]